MFGGYETYIPSKSGDMYRKIVPASIRKNSETGQNTSQTREDLTSSREMQLP